MGGGLDDITGGMLSALGVGVTAKIVSDVSGSMFNNIAKTQPRRPIAKAKKQFYKTQRVASYESERLGVQPKRFGQSWNGDFSNIGF